MQTLNLNHPLAPILAAYTAGVLIARWFQPAIPTLAIILIFFLILPLIPALRKYGLALAWPLLALAGGLNFAARTAPPSDADLRVLLGNEPAVVTLRGKLAETPRLKILQRGDQETWRSVAQVRVSEIRRNQDEHFQPACGEVLCTAPEALGPEFFSGQSVEIAGVSALPPRPLAEGLFDYRSYLATRGIYYELRTESTNDWSMRRPALTRRPLTDRFLDWSHQTLALGLPEEDEPLRLLWAMTLGWRSAFTGDIAEPFLQAGTMHMFAIDGLRIALLSGIIVTMLRVLRLGRAWCGCIAIPAVWFYTAATGWEASAVRASIMMSIVLVGWALKRPADLLNSLAAAALIILALDPRQLFEASFQLSFMVMLVIALALPPLNEFSDRLIVRWLGADPLLLEELVPAWRKKLVAWSQWLARFMGLSLAAWMGSLPLSAKYFHLFSPISTAANLLAVPLGALAIMANLGALVCGHWLPFFTVMFNHAAWFFMSAMTRVSVEFARLPGGFIYVREPSVAMMALYYGVVIAVCSGWFKSASRKVCGAALLLVIGGACLWQWQSTRAETDLTVLPLSGGHAIYVDAAGRRNDWLINCGNEDAFNSTLKNFLRAQGVNSLPRLALADGNARNCGAARLAGELFDVGELWTSDMKFRSAAYRQAVAYFENDKSRTLGGRHRILNYGGAEGAWRVLFPGPATAVSRADDAALVLLGNFHGARVLLLSELSRSGQSELLARTNDLRADIVIAGLPTQGEPLCDALLAVAQPQVIVIADSEFPAGRRAGRELKERLERTKIPVIYTRTAGAVKIAAGNGRWMVRTMEGPGLAGIPRFKEDAR